MHERGYMVLQIQAVSILLAKNRGLGSSSSCSVVFHCLRPHGLEPTRLHCPWNSPGKKAGVSCHSLLQEIFLTQGSNPHLLPLQADCLSSEPWVVSIDYPGLRMNVVKKQTLNKKFTVGKGYKKYRVL